MREIATIILLTKNGDKWLNGVLESIFHQNNSNQFHVIALDSNSTDNTLDILSKHPVKITSLDESNFQAKKRLIEEGLFDNIEEIPEELDMCSTFEEALEILEGL